MTTKTSSRKRQPPQKPHNHMHRPTCDPGSSNKKPSRTPVCHTCLWAHLFVGLNAATLKACLVYGGDYLSQITMRCNGQHRCTSRIACVVLGSEVHNVHSSYRSSPVAGGKGWGGGAGRYSGQDSQLLLFASTHPRMAFIMCSRHSCTPSYATPTFQELE